MSTEELRWVCNISEETTVKDYEGVSKMQIKTNIDAGEIKYIQDEFVKFITHCAGIVFDCKLECKSVYANFADTQSKHTQHTDAGYDYSCVFFVTTDWSVQDAGELVFADMEDEIAFSLKPKPKRAVFFKSSIEHVPRCPSPVSNKSRYTIAFKFIKTGELDDNSQTEVVQSHSESQDESFEDSLQGQTK